MRLLKLFFLLSLGSIVSVASLTAQSLIFRYAGTSNQYANTAGLDYVRLDARYTDFSGTIPREWRACPNLDNFYGRICLRRGSSNLSCFERRPGEGALGASGTFSTELEFGPSADQQFVLNVRVVCTSNQSRTKDNTDVDNTVRTVALKAPTNLVASEKLLQGIRLTWRRGTDVPDDKHRYIIYRDGTAPANSIDTIAGGDALEYLDPVGPDAVHTYYVRTYTPGFGHQKSAAVMVSGTSFALNFRSANENGEPARNATILRWNELVGFTTDGPNLRAGDAPISVRIFREGAIDPIVTDNLLDNINLTDATSVPGLPTEYRMRITLQNEEVVAGFDTLRATGFRRPNGVIAGRITTPEGLAVTGLEVCATAPGAACPRRPASRR
ncbi:MAG: hypothetical protein AAGA62_15910, partial [Bacteroidota bacterium]